MAKRKKRGEAPVTAAPSGEEVSRSDTKEAVRADKSEVSERTVVDPEVLTKFLAEQEAKEAAKKSASADLRRVDDELEALMPSPVGIEPTNSGAVSPAQPPPAPVEDEESTGKGFWDEESVAKEKPAGEEGAAGREGDAADHEGDAAEHEGDAAEREGDAAEHQDHAAAHERDAVADARDAAADARDAAADARDAAADERDAAADERDASADEGQPAADEPDPAADHSDPAADSVANPAPDEPSAPTDAPSSAWGDDDPPAPSSDSSPGTDPSMLGDAFPADDHHTDPEALGPAFPSDDGAGSPHSVATEAVPDWDADAPAKAPQPQLSRESPTSSKPGPRDRATSAGRDAVLPDAASDASASWPDLPPTEPTPAVRPEQDDAWAGVDDAGAWRQSQTGESKVKVKPKRSGDPAPGEPGYGRRQTNVFALGSEVASEDGARLVCIGGEDEGKEFALKQRTMTVGRAPSSDIVLADPSVSRDHARVLREKDDFFVLDKRSGNGTFVNRERIAKQKLESGDVVMFGKAKFRFLEIGDVFKPVDEKGTPVVPGAGRAEKHWVKPALISGTILFLTLVLAVLIQYYKGGGARAKDEMAYGYYLRGVDAFKNRQWDEAEKAFTVYLGLDPLNEKGRAYAESITREKAYQAQLESARQAATRGDLLLAYTQAAGIGDSVYGQEARDLIHQIEAELDARVQRAKVALDENRAKDALDLLTNVDAIRPGRPDVAALMDRARGQGTSSAQKPPPSGQTISIPQRQAPAASTPADRALEAFLAGNLSGAMDAASASGDDRDAQVLAAKIEKFQQTYDAAVVEHRAKRADSAIRQIEQAKLIEAKISNGRRSTFVDDLNHKLADMYYVKGIEAGMQQRWEEARKAFEAALAADPSHQQAQRQLQEVKQRLDAPP